MSHLCHRTVVSGLSRNEIDRYVRQEEMKEDSRGFSDIEQRLRDSRHDSWPCDREFRLDAWLTDLSNWLVEGAWSTMEVLLLVAGSSLFIPRVLTMIISMAMINKSQLIKDVWRRDYDVRTRIGKTMIIVFQLSLQDDLEFILADCVELLAERSMTEIDFWRSFVCGAIGFSLRRRLGRICSPANEGTSSLYARHLER